MITLTNQHLLILADGVEAVIRAGSWPHGPLTPEMHSLARNLHLDLAGLIGSDQCYTLSAGKVEKNAREKTTVAI